METKRSQTAEVKVYNAVPDATSLYGTPANNLNKARLFDTPAEYAAYLKRFAQESEAHGFWGTLIFTANSDLDPWHVADMILNATDRLTPLVAVQPAYMHPFTVAKKVASLAFLYQRRIELNFVAGGYRGDLVALGDSTPHDERYERLQEYALLIRALLRGSAPVTFTGKYYNVKNLRVLPRVPEHLLPGFLISGSSGAGLDVASQIGATAISYPAPNYDFSDDRQLSRGIRLGILCREEEETAWKVARERFPNTETGRKLHEFALAVTDSQWYKTNSAAGGAGVAGSTFWYEPLKTYQSFCPYLVGSYDNVAEQIAKYISRGYKTILVETPPEDEVEHFWKAVRAAERLSEVTTQNSMGI
jgi:alkanesulfonate monooxygenase